ncbi:hypothetical protein AVL61_02170 [Kocuria rosea subsp. polaris]|uniref:Uncharacterized protein n=1 Tax=Kocuria rosea subsp. polaris TaxID=136273 RepID=A0A0W8IN46_KOCRO|nr:hypothetical protein [Kocuria polaris]KUG61730.1 hypothetical protein AVL61_02170 [Kocuria polaris]
MNASPASAAHASFFSYTGTDCDPDLALPTHADTRSAPLWVLAVSSACVGAAMGRLSTRRP